MASHHPRYSIDTCSLTEVRRVYPEDVFPGVWEKLDELVDKGIVIACELVEWEIEVQDDELNEWAADHAEMFHRLDEALQEESRQILASHPSLVDTKKRKSGADAFIVGLARLKSLAVVTQEKPSGGPEKEKIPDVCRAMKIDCIPVLEMFRREGLRLR